MSRDLGQIFTQIGEEWIEDGQHFIPLRSGGQINLNAEAYPIINLSDGKSVIVDIHNDLPENVTRLIASSWGNYKVVHLKEKDDLRNALDKILSECNYSQVYRLGEPFELDGDISIKIAADWIIERSVDQAKEREKMVVIALMENNTSRTSPSIKTLLNSLSIKVIDYPFKDEPEPDLTEEVEILDAGHNRSNLVKILLELTGQHFSSHVKIPVYQTGKNFELIINADFFLNIMGRDCILDLTGLGEDILSLLKKHQFLVLSLADEKESALIVKRTLKFLDIQFDSGQHTFMAIERDRSRNIMLTIPGIIFRDHVGQSIFAVSLIIPEEIKIILAEKGYKILNITF